MGVVLLASTAVMAVVDTTLAAIFFVLDVFVIVTGITLTKPPRRHR